MTHTTHGAQSPKDAPEKESAGGCKDEFAATTADTNNAPITIAIGDRKALGIARYASIFEPLALGALGALGALIKAAAVSVAAAWRA